MGKGCRLAVLLLRGVEDYLRCPCMWNQHAHGLRLALCDDQTKRAGGFDEDRLHPPPARVATAT